MSSSFALALLAPMAIAGPAQGQGSTSPNGYVFHPAEDDAPGTRYWIPPEDLPVPVNEGDPEAPDCNNPPTLVDQPRGTKPQVPESFVVWVVAKRLNQPRVLRTAPNGDVFVAESGSGRVLVFTARSLRHLPARPEIFTQGLDRPFGIAFYPPSRPRYVYVQRPTRSSVTRTGPATALREGRPG